MKPEDKFTVHLTLVCVVLILLTAVVSWLDREKDEVPLLPHCETCICEIPQGDNIYEGFDLTEEGRRMLENADQIVEVK